MDECQNAQKGSRHSRGEHTTGSQSQSMSLKRSNKRQATGLANFRWFFEFSLTFWAQQMLAADKAATARFQNMETYKFLSAADI